MKLAYPDIGKVFQWPSVRVPSLVIENRSLFRKIVKDFSTCMDGTTTPVVLSIENRVVTPSKYAELITDPIRFDINSKSLLNKVMASLEKNALSPEYYLQTTALLSDMERMLGDWSFELSCQISAAKISVSNLLKACGVMISDDYEGPAGELERLLDHMQLTRELDRDKLFILVNIRSYYEDTMVEDFLESIQSHGYRVLLLDSCSYPRLQEEERWTVDPDLCEF